LINGGQREKILKKTVKNGKYFKKIFRKNLGKIFLETKGEEK